MFKWIRIAAMCLLASTAGAQYYSINIDSQHPKTDYLVPFQYAANTPFLKASFYDGAPTPIDMTLWACEMDVFQTQFSTNGVFIVPGVFGGSNEIDFLGSTNVWPAPRDYWFSIKGTYSSGYTKTWATGRLQVLYDPSVSSNMWSAMQQINLSWLTNWIGAQVGSNTLNIANLTATFNATSGQVTTALGTLTTNLAAEVSRATNAEAIVSNSVNANVTAEYQRATNAEAAVSNYVNTEVAVEATRATNAEAVLQGEIISMSVSSNQIYRYVAMTNGNNKVDVLASGLGITASLGGSTITVSIPTGVRIFTAQVQWDGINNGSSFILDIGTTDVLNDNAVDRWAVLFQSYRLDTGALIPGAQARIDPANFSQYLVQGLSPQTINYCRFSW
jgi:hypothetical protein